MATATIADPVAALRELISEASEYAGPLDDDTSNNAGIWKVIDEAEDAINVRPYVVAFLEGGLVQTDVCLPGVGEPTLVVLDFDREESTDLDELKEFAQNVHEAADEMFRRGFSMDSAWIKQADEFVTDETQRRIDEAARSEPSKRERAAALLTDAQIDGILDAQEGDPA